MATKNNKGNRVNEVEGSNINMDTNGGTFEEIFGVKLEGERGRKSIARPGIEKAAEELLAKWKEANGDLTPPTITYMARGLWLSGYPITQIATFMGRDYRNIYGAVHRKTKSGAIFEPPEPSGPIKEE